MPSHTIDINVNDKTTPGSAGGIAGRAGRASAADDSSIIKLSRILKAALEENSKKTGSAIDKALQAALKDILRGHQRGGGGMSDSRIKEVLRGVGKDMAREITKSISKAVPTSPSQKPIDDNALARKIDGSINNAADRMARTLSDRLSRQLGVTIDEEKISRGIGNAVRKSLPQGTGTATRDLVSAVSSLKTISRDIGTLVQSVKGMRASGGKVDITEIGHVVTSIKKVAKDVKDLGTEAQKAKDSFAVLAKEAPDTLKEFNKILGQVKRKATIASKGVAERASEDPRKFGKEIATSILGAIKKSDSLKGTKLEAAANKLEKAATSMDNFSKEFKNFKQVVRGEVKGGRLSVEGATKLAKDFERIVGSLSNLPKDLGFEDMPKQMEETLKGLEKFSKKASQITTQVKMVVDDSALKKITDKPVEVPVQLQPDSKNLYKEVKTTLESAIKAFSDAPIEANLKPVVKELTEIRAKISNDSFFGARKQLESVLQRQPLKIDANAKAAYDVLRQFKSALDDFQSELMLELGVDYKPEPVQNLKRDIVAAQKATKQLAVETAKVAKEMDKLDRGKAASRGAANMQEAQLHSRMHDPMGSRDIFEKGIIRPGAENYKSPPISKTMSMQAEKIKAETDRRMKGLANSLQKLQLDIIKNLEENFAQLNKKGTKKWQIVRPGGEQDDRKLFRQQSQGRQWSIQIADIKKIASGIKNLTGSGVTPTGTAEELVNQYKSLKAGQIVKETKTAEMMAERVGRWLKNLTPERVQQTKGLNPLAVDKLLKVQRSYKDERVVSKEMSKAILGEFGSKGIGSILAATDALDSVARRMQQSGMVRNVALPAASMTEEGSAYFRTLHGSQRALPRFAQFETGLERMQQLLFDTKKFQQTFKGHKSTINPYDFGKRISGLKTARPVGADLDAAESIASDMFKELVKSPARPEHSANIFEGIKKNFRDAAKVKSAERQRQGFGAQSDVTGAVENVISTFSTIPANEQTITDFLSAMKQAGVSAYDAVKTLDRIKSFNVYDVMGQVLKAQGGPLQKLGEQPTYSKSIRDFENAISEVEGLLPLLESNRPRRGYHQESVVNLLTRRSGIYKGDYSDRLDPTEQKNYIKDLNFRLDEVIRDQRILGTPVGGGLKRIQSLGIPESMAGNVQELRPGSTTGTTNLNRLNATQFRLYSEDIPSLAPFKQFQQAGRNIANVTNAMTDLNQEFAESPLLRSQKEKALIESTRYGKGKYGYNVTAELRNTAANFEDQILIAGKLAQAFTQATKILIKPGQRGRIRGKEGEEDEQNAGVTKIQNLEFEKNVEKVLREYMTILGTPEKYEGRADKAFVKSIGETIAVIRGEDIQVQQAKLTEKFLNYFGRKFTTRYGSKGVSITPTGQASDLPKLLAEYAGKPIKVDPSATLGYAKTPKSIGQLASQLFGNEVSDKLKKELIASGNKFIIDMFHQVGDSAIVTEDEARKTQELYMQFAEAWQRLFGSDVPTPDTKGIAQIRSKFQDKDLYDFKPIDVRISSYGAAKRGLQTEFMEAIFGNVAGTGPGGATTVPVLKQDAYQKLLGKPGQAGALSEYSKALGFEGVGKTPEEILKDPKVYGADKLKEVQKLLKEKGREGASGKELDMIKEYDDAMKAAVLESTSSFYSQIIDELGTQRQSLVGPKFLQIVEEPTENPEWQRGQIERGTKGARLNLPAFSAYATVFGEQSAIIQEIQKSLDVNAKKHWEYLKALQTINEQDSAIYDELTSNLRTIDISALQKFSAGTGIYGAEHEYPDGPEGARNERSLANTVLDIDKYPDPFKLTIPTGKKTAAGEIAKEELYVPGALARGTYPDPLIAGEYGLDQMSRRLTHLTNMAKDLNDLLTNPEQYMQESANFNMAGSIEGIVGKMTREANEIRNRRGPDTIARLNEMINTLQPVLSSEHTIDPSVIEGTQFAGLTETDFFEKFSEIEREKVRLGPGKEGTSAITNKKIKGKTAEYAMAYMVSTLSDLIINKNPKYERYNPQASTVLKRSQFAGKTTDLAKQLGIDVEQEAINNQVSALQKAKVDYYNSLAETALGKEGSINELLFSRKIPAVMGKAVVAVTDKRKDIQNFAKDLYNIESKYAGENISAAEGLGDLAQQTKDVFKSHSDVIKRYREVGVPVLSQEQLGVPETFAEKIPVQFKGARINRGKLIKDEKVKTGTLADLIKQTQEFKFQEAGARAGGNTELADEIQKYIDNELVNYIESIRFPFTGVSSLAPYKPKLIGDKSGKFRDREGRALESNALIVPGVPEGAEELDEVIKKVKDRIDSLIKDREDMYDSGASQEEIDKLTSLIRELSAAVANVIPKYTAQAQKLDFDGDQIEIHAAKTAEARKNIATQFQQYHVRDPKDFSTAEVFRDYFLNDAVVPSTGENLLAESRKAFGKKFPGQSFDFLKSPFLTEDLEYLSPEAALESFAEKKDDYGNLANIIQSVLEERLGNQERTTEIMRKLAEVDQNDAKALVEAVRQIDQDNLFAIVERGIKDRLREEKVKDAVEAQLFKIHTGPETEGLYRVHRIAESNLGFGTEGQLQEGPEGFRASEYFQKRFPMDLKSLGGNAAEEFHTAMNEILRFGIQKGMDVKHAGAKPIAGEMVKYLSKDVAGANKLYERILTDDSFKELKKFDEANKTAIETRLGALDTPEIAKEARKILSSRGEDVSVIDQMVGQPEFRQKLKDLIVKKVGLQGFLQELAMLIKKEAVEGLIAQAEEWTPETRSQSNFGLAPVTGDIGDWARGEVQKMIDEGGINIAKTVTSGKQGLYPFRTYSASTSEELKAFKRKYGDVGIPKGLEEGLAPNIKEDYLEKYRKAMATSRNVRDQLQAFDFSQQGGAYADMVRSSVEVMYAEQAEMAAIVANLNKEGYDSGKAKTLDLGHRVLTGEGVSSWADSIISNTKGMNNMVKEFSELAGVPELGDPLKYDIEEKYSSKFRDIARGLLESRGESTTSDEAQKYIDDYVKKQVAKVQALSQLDRVIDVMKSRSNEPRVLEQLLPKAEMYSRIDTSIPSRQDAINEARKAMAGRRPAAQRDLNIAAAMANDAQEAIQRSFGPGSDWLGPPPDAMAGMPASSIVPVHLMGAEQSAVVSVRCLEGAGFSPASSRTPVSEMQEQSDLAAEMKKSNETLKSIIAKTRSGTGQSVSMEEFYSPSRLAGGGKYRFKDDYTRYSETDRHKDQIERIAQKMQGLDTPGESTEVLADWGTAMHAKLEESLKKDKKVKTEVYKELDNIPGVGTIGGTADIVEYETEAQDRIAKIADIKTVDQDKFERITDLIKKAKSSKLEDVLAKAEPDIEHKLQDYFSQLNTYLKLFEAGTAEIRFYSREGFAEDPSDYAAIQFDFDPERFKKDMEAISKAREAVPAGKFKTMSRGAGPGGTGASIEELNQAMMEAQKQYEYLRTERPGVRGMAREDDEDVQAQLRQGQKNLEAHMKQRAASAGPSRDERYIMSALEPNINYEQTTDAFFENLKNLHDQATIFQASKGLDTTAIKQLPEPVQELLSQVKGKGPDYDAFIELTGRLKDMKNAKGKSVLGGAGFMKAWKAYRIEVGNWLIAEAERAKMLVDEAEESGDTRAANKAYGQYKASVNRLQEFVRRSVGKRTDIYTEDKSFVYPKLAQAAGVYMSPNEITKKIGEPLGDDEQLISTFNDIRNNIKKVNIEPASDIAQNAFRELSNMNTELVELLNNAKDFQKAGIDIEEAFDFEKLASRATRLREALQQVLREVGELDAVQKKNIDNLVKYLKNVEGMYSQVNFQDPTAEGQIGLLKVPKFESPAVQGAINERNLRKVREYFTRGADEGGAQVGQRFSYTEQVVGSSGETLKKVVHHFNKYSEAVNVAGRSVGQFNETQHDLIERMQKTNATFGNALRRVIMWGAASRLIYGGVSQLKSSLDELADIEVGIARLRMVLNPLDTDFGKLSKSAVGFAKQYGVPVTNVLDSMRVFAQQGLKQSDVIGRTQTATLASNVTTLNAKEATEALTAAMKVFREEGNKSLRFLDSWSEVEAKHAITAEDMANAIKKSAAAAKTAGVDFDELNGIVAAIGATTRQSGKEVGTSLRFIFRRLFSEEGPKALAGLDISTATGSGENRRGFDILSDLAGKWKDLTQAQKLNIAQSIGGTRQYNSLLVLMDQWDEALRGIRNSTNSKGSAERRNAEIMKTYTKQLEQMKAAATELKMEFGKVVLPAFKVGVTGVKLLLEGLAAIPGPAKAAAAAIAGIFTFGAKGFALFDGIESSFAQGSSAIGGFIDSFMDQWKLAKYEISGRGLKGQDVLGLKVITPAAKKFAESMGSSTDFGKSLVEQGSKVSDFQSSFAKALFLAVTVGRSFNEMLGEMAVSAGAAGEVVGETTKDVGHFFSTSLAALSGAKKLNPKELITGFQDAASGRGLGASDVAGLIEGGLDSKKLLKFGSKITAFAGEIGGVAAAAVGSTIDYLSEAVGGLGGTLIKDFSTQNAGLIKSLAPLVLTIAALTPAIKSAAEGFKEMAGSAQDFDKSLDSSRRKNEENLKSVRELIQEYDALTAKVKDINKTRDPAVKKRRQALGTYESPLVASQDLQQRTIDLSNRIAETNLNMVLGYNKLGDAVLRTTGNFKNYLKELERVEVLAGAETELSALERYTEDLTGTGKNEKLKKTFKELFEAFPVVGELASRNIKLSPAVALQEAVKDINKRINLKQKYPLSTVIDEDIKRLQEILGKARGEFRETYSDLKKTYENILAPSSLEGLTDSDIDNLVRSPELQKARELIIQIDPKFRSATPQQLLARDLLTALNPTTKGSLDFTARFTKANLESAGVLKRTEKAFVGDIVTFFDNVARAYNIEGGNAIVKLDEANNMVVEYFNSKTLEVEQMPVDKIKNLVDAVFPVNPVREELAYRLESLNTFVAGAAAGLVGIDKKTFKKDFDLGPRFFGDIPTTTLLQGDFGFSPSRGYGRIPGMENFGKELNQFYLEPREELQKELDNLSKLRLKGLEEGTPDLPQDTYDRINNLLTVLKNNQAVVQFRAVFVDMMKEIANGTRVLKEDIAVQKLRNKVNVQAAGLTRNLAKDLEGIDYGVYNPTEVTATQRLLTGSSNFQARASRAQQLQATIDSSLALSEQITRAMVQVDDILANARGSGALINSENIKEFVKQVPLDAENKNFFELKNINKDVADNTGTMVNQMDRMLANQGDMQAIGSLLFTVRKNLDKGIMEDSPKRVVKALELTADLRKKAAKQDNQEAVMFANQLADDLSQLLLSQVGYDKGAEMIRKDWLHFSKDFTSDEFLQRALKGVDPRAFVSAIKKYAGEESREGGINTRDFEQIKAFKKYEKAQNQQVKATLFSSKNLSGLTAISGSIAHLQKMGNKDIIAKLDEQIGTLDTQIEMGRAAGKGEPELKELLKTREALQMQREQKVDDASFYGVVESLSAAGLASMQLARAFGLTELEIKFLGGAATGTYAAVKLASTILGKELPESAKKVQEELVKLGKQVGEGEKPTVASTAGLRKAGKELASEVKTKTAEVFKGQEEAVQRTHSMIDDQMKAAEGLEKSFTDLKSQMDAFKAKGEEYAGYADLKGRQQLEKTELLRSGKLQDSAEYKDLLKTQKVQTAEFFKGMDADKAAEITGAFPKLDPKAYGSFLRANYGDELEGIGEDIVKGIENAGGGDRIAQLLVAYLALSLSNYAANLSADKTNLAESEKALRSETEALIELIKANPAAATMAFKEVDAQQKQAAKIKDTTPQTKTEATAQDVEEGRKKVRESLKKEGREQVKIAQEAQAKLRRIMIAQGDERIREEYRMADMETARNERDAADAAKIARKYSFSNLINESLKGFSGDIELPLDRSQMSTQQRIFADASDANKKLITQYSEGARSIDVLRQRLEQLKQAARQEEELKFAATDPEIIAAAAERHADLNEKMEKQIKILDEAGEAARKFGEAYLILNKFTEAIQNFERSLEDVRAGALTQAVEGFREYRQAVDNMFGGGGIDAPVEISAEDERMGSRVGVPLRHLRSTRYDLQRAQLLDRRRTATGEERRDIDRQLMDLPEQRRRDAEAAEQRRQNEMALAGNRPYEEYVDQISRIIATTDLEPGQRQGLESFQMEMAKVMTNALKAVSPQTLLKELEANRGALTQEEYDKEFSRIQGLQEAVSGGKWADVFRGIPKWEQNRITGLQDQIKESLSQMPTMEGLINEASITDPITQKLDETNSILKIIAEEGMGVEDLVKKLETLQAPKNIVKPLPIPLAPAHTVQRPAIQDGMMKAHAAGGYISGPGGPKDDKIPAMLSDGEYVIKTASAKKLGYGFLDALNSTGEIPKFSEGGGVGRFFRDMSDELGGFTDYLSEKRMSEVYREKEGFWDHLKSIGSQGGLAAVELASRLTNVAAGAGAGVEGVADYLISNDIDKVKKDIKMVAGGIKSQIDEKGLVGVGREIKDSLVKAAKDDFEKGGLGITTAVMEAVTGAHLAKALKSGKLASKLGDATSELPTMRKALGIMDAPGVNVRGAETVSAGVLDAVQASLSQHNKLAPGFLDKTLGLLDIGTDINKYKYAGLSKQQQYAKGVIAGKSFDPKAGAKYAEATGGQLAKDKSAIVLAARAMKNPKLAKQVADHEFAHNMYREFKTMTDYLDMSPDMLKRFPELDSFQKRFSSLKQYADSFIETGKGPSKYAQGFIDKLSADPTNKKLREVTRTEILSELAERGKLEKFYEKMAQDIPAQRALAAVYKDAEFQKFRTGQTSPAFERGIADASAAAEQVAKTKKMQARAAKLQESVNNYVAKKAQTNPAMKNVTIEAPDEIADKGTDLLKQQMAAIRSVIDEVDSHVKEVPGFTDSKPLTVSMKHRISAVQEALSPLGEEVGGDIAGINVPNVGALQAAKKLKTKVAQGGDAIFINKDIIKDPKYYESLGYSAKYTAKHELGHRLSNELSFFQNAADIAGFVGKEFSDKIQKVREILESASRSKTGLPTENAGRSAEEAFADLYAVGDPSVSKPARALRGLMAAARDPQTAQQIKDFQKVVDEKRAGKIRRDTLARMESGAITEEQLGNIYALVDELRFGMGGHVKKRYMAEGGIVEEESKSYFDNLRDKVAQIFSKSVDYDVDAVETDKALSYLESGKAKKERYDNMLEYNQGGKAVRRFTAGPGMGSIKEYLDDELVKTHSRKVKNSSLASYTLKTPEEKAAEYAAKGIKYFDDNYIKKHYTEPKGSSSYIPKTSEEKAAEYAAKGIKYFDDNYIKEHYGTGDDHVEYSTSGTEGQLWAVQTAKDAAAKVKSVREGRGLVDKKKLPEGLRDYVADEFMSLGPRYDTDQYRRALERKKSFREDADVRRARFMAGEMTKQITAEAEFTDAMGAKPESQNIGGDYAKRMADRQKVRSAIATGPRDESKYGAIPNRIRDLKRMQEYTAMVQENLDALNEAGFTSLTADKLAEYADMTDSALKHYAKGGDLSQLGFQHSIDDALDSYSDMQAHALMVRKLNDAKLTGLDEINYRANPKAYVELKKGLKAGTMTPDLELKLRNKIKASTIAFEATEDERTAFWNQVKAYEAAEKEGELQSFLDEMIKKQKQKKGITGFTAQAKGKASSQAVRQRDIAAAYAADKNAFSPGSAPAMHNGGVVAKTGQIFAQKGEVVLSKGFAEGGMVENDLATKALSQTTKVTVDASELESAMSSAVSKLSEAIPTEIKVEDKELKVEDKEFKVEVEQPSWKVEVEAPESNIKVDIDVAAASSQLSDAITSALSTPVKVDSSGVQAVGGERLDTLAESVKTVQDRLIVVKDELEGQIKLLGQNNETNNIDSRIITLVDSRMANVNKDVADLRTDVGQLQSNTRRNEQMIETRYSDLDYRLNNTMNITGIGKF